MRGVLFAASLGLVSLAAAAQSSSWTTWSASQAESIGRSTHANGRVGNWGTIRLLKTERAISYKLSATWMTPDVIHASARLLQLRSRLSDEEALQAVSEAETVRDTVVMVEMDPDEGSGVIPVDWEGFLQPKGVPERAVSGTKAPKLRDVRTLMGVLRRNYDYDRFWIAFPLTTADGKPLFHDSDTEAELVVRIYEREGRVSWPIPPSIRARMKPVSYNNRPADEAR